MRGDESNRYNSAGMSNSRIRKMFNSVITFDRGTLYERALKKQELRKLNNEAALEKEEREFAACSFQPNI